MNGKDPDPEGQLIQDPPDPDPQHCMDFLFQNGTQMLIYIYINPQGHSNKKNFTNFYTL